MNHAATLGEVLEQAPTAAAAGTALDALLELANAGDLPAAQALAAALARKLGHEDALPAIQALQSVSAVLAQERIPALLQLYLLAFSPRDLRAQVAACAKLKSAARVPADFLQFQRLVRRNDVLQHEALKAYWLCMFVSVDALSASAGGWGLRLQSGWQRVLDSLLAEGKVTPGDSATTNFTVGRELILRCTADGLATVLAHELGHHLFDLTMAQRGLPPPAAGDSAAPSAGDVLALAGTLPHTLRTARSGRELTRQSVGSEGSLLVSVVQEPGGSYLHLSLSLQGAPIALPVAALWATVVLQLLGIANRDAAAAYSARGVFHFGFRATVDPDTLVGPRDETEAGHRLEGCITRSDAWLTELTTSHRLGPDQDSVAVALGLRPPAARFFPSDPSPWRDMELCGKHAEHDAPFQLSLPEAQQLLRSALRCAHLPLVDGLLEGGIKPAADGGDLRAAGSSFGVVQPPDQAPKAYYGPNASTTFALFRLLHARGVDLNVAIDERGTTLLLDAVRQEGAGVAVLLSLGVDPNRADLAGHAPLHAAVGSRRPDLIEQLLRAGAAHDRRNATGLTPLAVAVALDDTAAVDALLKAGADTETRDVTGATPLMSAASGSVTQSLLHAGAKPNTTDRIGRTALMAAASAGRTEVMKLLLEAGAEAEAADDRGLTAMHGAAALSGAEARSCLTLLLDRGADTEEDTTEGVTPLMVAAQAGSVEAVKLLLARGADANARTKSRNTALIIAFDPAQQWSRNFARTSQTEDVARALVAGGADVNAQNDAGVAALHLAARIADAGLARTLLELGAKAEGRSAEPSRALGGAP